jgi:hypothetical protein
MHITIGLKMNHSDGLCDGRWWRKDGEACGQTNHKYNVRDLAADPLHFSLPRPTHSSSLQDLPATRTRLQAPRQRLITTIGTSIALLEASVVSAVANILLCNAACDQLVRGRLIERERREQGDCHGFGDGRSERCKNGEYRDRTNR